MQVEVISAMVQQLRETIEGNVGASWITDGKPDSGVIGFIETLSAENALREPIAGHRSVAEHVAHLRFSLTLMYQRMQGEDPPANWKDSFTLTDKTPAGWEQLKRDLKKSYDDVMRVVNAQAKLPLSDWPPIYVVGLAAMTAHNAYHLGAIRQIGLVVAARAAGGS